MPSTIRCTWPESSTSTCAISSKPTRRGKNFGPTIRGPRKFYQGLIQVAVALHHFGNGNIRGAKKLYLSSSAYLQPYRPVYQGLDLEKLLAEFEHCFEEVLASQEQFPKIDIIPDRIPEIHLNSPPQA